uniref:Glycogen [starch] synthase n=1 Tax=Parascaris univalens TaxID=6257 RepID=A0A915ANM7_PARUN
MIDEKNARSPLIDLSRLSFSSCCILKQHFCGYYFVVVGANYVDFVEHCQLLYRLPPLGLAEIVCGAHCVFSVIRTGLLQQLHPSFSSFLVLPVLRVPLPPTYLSLLCSIVRARLYHH